MATNVSGTFTATGQSPTFQPAGLFNLTLSGTFTGTVSVERSFDGGATWNVVALDGYGNAATFSAPISLIAQEVEANVLWRFDCTAYTSGTIAYRFSQ